MSILKAPPAERVRAKHLLIMRRGELRQRRERLEDEAGALAVPVIVEGVDDARLRDAEDRLAAAERDLARIERSLALVNSTL